MSADLLRKAAGLMRECAEKATPSPWFMAAPDRTFNPSVGTRQVEGAEEFEVDEWVAECRPGTSGTRDSRFIASWHPAVAVAVADWLDGLALLVEAREDEEYFDLDGDPIAPEDTHARGSALAVARAYLGREA